MEQKIIEMIQKIDAKIDKIDARFDHLEENMNSRFYVLAYKINELDEKLTQTQKIKKLYSEDALKSVEAI